MRIEDLRSALPDYAKDLRLNLGAATGPTSLTEQQQWGVLLAAAIASRNEPTLAAIDAEAAEHLSPEAVDAAKAAAAIMAMNNVYYRFVHLVSDPEYATLPARLRMNVIGKPGVDQLDFELWSLAVSVVNGCGRCIDAHDHAIREKGGTKEAVQDAVRLAAIVHAVAVTFEAEDHFAAATAFAS